MDYPFENLGPEKFQEFAQALLAKEFPDLQCFPVAQPDGGRDIISYDLGSFTHNFAIYQVKYVRKPDAEKDTHQWLLGIIESEAPKVKSLIEKGAKQFFLITNIRGTAHLDAGSIDKMNHLLEVELGIPSRCWWRDDLSRKLDDAWNLKWVYPELMTGPDLIRSIIEFGLSEHQERRASAIRAFVTEQFISDQIVKFKQVDLQNRLLNLFIDVPALLLRDRENPRRIDFHHQHIYSAIAHRLVATGREKTPIDDSRFLYFEKNKVLIGAATLLLHPIIQKRIPWIVLEGAPGQGKSTVTQYLCQIHRMRLFGPEETRKLLPDDYKNSEGLFSIPEHHVTSQVCLPFRVDLRDLASWLSGINPFASENEASEISSNHKSLEEFLALLVNHFSGGIEFSAADLIAVFKRSPILLAFDGLDEVADIEKRRDVVNTIQTGVKRLKSNALSLQVIVTSRPAAFANSPGLSESDFVRFYLDSLSKPLIDEYSEKWMNAKKLDQRERSEVKKILKDKLDQPHIRDLARNPMQLTILLSLIYNRGSSLPDKRTALYYSYVDLFFNREAEKTPIVKKYRDLLLDIHKYIAWILHSEAEQYGKSGRITQEDLQKVIHSYLDQEGHEVDIARELVTGAIERIVALVSRVEGTYEFEVQPLREYFVARYLYETARHSSPGKEYSGTKPDRFDALARNFYWLNVARFYAGCYDKGELPSLIDRLEDLINSEGYKLISHPRLLAATLLSDWVFSQHPKSVKTVMSLILDGMGIRYVLPSANRRIGLGEPMILPTECGREELIKHCFSLLNEKPRLDFALDIISLISANSTSPKDNFTLWLENVLNQRGKARTEWLGYGLYLGILSQPSILALDKLINICADLPYDENRLDLLYKARRFDYLEKSEEIFNATLQLILNKSFNHNSRRPKNIFILELLNEAVNAFRYAVALREPRPISFSKLLSQNYSLEYSLIEDNEIDTEDKNKQYLNYKNIESCLKILEIVNRDIKLDAAVWASDLRPWNNLIEAIRSCWGDMWICFHLANIASGIKSSLETYIEYSDLFDTSKDLCKRVRYARLRAGQYSWWANQFEKMNTHLDIASSLLILITWGSPKTLAKIIHKIDDVVHRLPDSLWENLYFSAEEAIMLTQSSRRDLSLDNDQLESNLNPKTAVLISLRAKQKTRKLLYTKYLKEYDGIDHPTLKICRDMSLEFLAKDFSIWKDVRTVIQRSYSNNMLFENYSFPRIENGITSKIIPDDIALEIASDPSAYPSFLVAIAEMKMKENVASSIVPVGEIANRDNWFEHL